MSYKVCVVPCCKSTTINTPDKVFIHVPDSPDLRKQWLRLARREFGDVLPKYAMYFCEDHFDLMNDMQNYMRFKIMGHVGQVRMKPNCLPTKFACQPHQRKRTMTPTSTPEAFRSKRQCATLIQDVEKTIQDTENSAASNLSDTTIQIVTKTWENIQDYDRESADTTNEDCPAKRKKHNLEDGLHFLLRSTEKKISPVENLEEISHVFIPEPPASSETDTDQSQSKPPNQTETPFQNLFTDNLQSASSLVQSTDIDADKCYILSLTDDYKSLTKEKKYAFQRLVLDFFCSIYHSNQTTDSSSATPNFFQQSPLQYEETYSPLQQIKSEQDDPLSESENKYEFSHIQPLDLNP